MTKTGWMGEAPDDGAPSLPLTEMLLANREHRAGPLETALARSRAADAREALDEAAEAPDPDEHAAGLVTRGYTPGLTYELSQRLGDATAELEAEREKIERGERRQEQVHRMHQNGQIRALDIPRLLGDDLGDPGRVSQLERRVESLKRQCAEAQEAISPPQQRAPDPLEAASRRAHQAFVEATRARIAETGQSRPQGSPPFEARGSAGAGEDAEQLAEITRSRPQGPESYQELCRLGRGQSSRGGCPPCSDCHYVICRCSQLPRAAGEPQVYA